MLPAALGAPQTPRLRANRLPDRTRFVHGCSPRQPEHPASCEAIMVFKPDLARLSQIDADVDEIDTRADEADSRVHKPLQNAFGA